MSTSLAVPPPSSLEELRLYKCLPIPRGSINDVWELQAIRMVIIHNVLIRAYNSMLHYSTQVSPDDAKRVSSFIRYCDVMNATLHEHHHVEESSYFPWLEERLGAGSMVANVEGHHAFETPFKAFEELVASIRDEKAPFVPDEFRSAVYGFLPPLLDHLMAEVETIRVDKVKHIPEVEMRKMESDTEKMIRKHSNVTTSVQACAVNGDEKYGLWFPPAPAPVLWVCMNITYRFNSDIWAFGACTKNRKIKPEFAAYEPELEPESS
ncbi:hypothetical protein FRB96_000297 [Tulasnella sp. 330]|nr:hypothetical protein FRB96_000297 [Tulasnella sp. 330]KAG8871498.1 hypothetical protein FRB97_008616 [Tulasnella sp. 331]KAG8886951.1 hypothetical protein FRB98_000723 [Tulasnella sp. 332]